MLKKLTAAILGAAAIFTPLESIARSNHGHHVALVRAALQTGIEMKINPKECDRESALGWYWAAQNELVVCQQNKRIGSTAEVSWTEEDYDTLRHEVHHLVQDCMSRGRRDGTLGAVYQDPIGVAKEVLGTHDMNRIAEAYSDRDNHTIVMEFEAFSVAAMNDPLEQVGDIRNYCF